MMKSIYIHRMSAVNPQFGGEMGRRFPQEKRLAAVEPDYKLGIPDAGLRRRMSRMVKMGVVAAMECLKQGNPSEIEAIITATGLGCLGDTEKFMNSILDNDERLLNPTAFIQSTFNTLGAQIALLCKNHHYNMTYVHRGLSFESALLDAQMMLDGDEAHEVLVGGVDELTDTGFRIMERMGFWRGHVAGEGAHFFVLGGKTEDCLGKIRGTMTFRGTLTEEEIRSKIRKTLDGWGVELRMGDWILSGDRNGKYMFPGLTSIDFKEYGGEYPTASAFALWMGIGLLNGQKMWDIPTQKMEKILIYNNYQDVNHAVILLERGI